MNVVPKRSFLVRQEEVEGGKRKDVLAKKGEKINLTEKEAIKFWGALDLSEADKKKLLNISKTYGHKRLV
jgi:hypothetical protein